MRIPVIELCQQLGTPPVVAVPVLAVIQADGSPQRTPVRTADATPDPATVPG